MLAELLEWRRRRAEVYVPLVHRPAESAQVDFFEVAVELAGERRRGWLLLFRLMHSGRDFVRLYERQDQLAFLDGHVRAFAHFGGVPRRMVYDNLSAAVRRVQFPRRQLTERFAALASHYAFEPSFARPGQGHDKGGVESRGLGLRLQVLTPVPRGDSLDQLSERIQAEIDRLAPELVAERFAREGPLLRPLPQVAFEPRRMQRVSVNRSAMVRLEGAWYSVPERWAGLTVTAWVGVSEVVFQRGAEQVSHPRQRFGGRRVRYRHYLGELSRKPQALRQVAPELVEELGGPYAELWTLLETERGGHEAAATIHPLGVSRTTGSESVPPNGVRGTRSDPACSLPERPNPDGIAAVDHVEDEGRDATHLSRSLRCRPPKPTTTPDVVFPEDIGEVKNWHVVGVGRRHLQVPDRADERC